MDRIDYSNDSATALVKGPLSINGYYIGATGNQILWILLLVRDLLTNRLSRSN